MADNTVEQKFEKIECECGLVFADAESANAHMRETVPTNSSGKYAGDGHAVTFWERVIAPDQNDR